MGRLLVVTGVIIAALGLVIMAGVPIGRLPGDIVIRRDGFTMYLPITTCIVISIVLTVIMSFLRR